MQSRHTSGSVSGTIVENARDLTLIFEKALCFEMASSTIFEWWSSLDLVRAGLLKMRLLENLSIQSLESESSSL